jgi:hypothetical protein
MHQFHRLSDIVRARSDRTQHVHGDDSFDITHRMLQPDIHHRQQAPDAGRRPACPVFRILKNLKKTPLTINWL